MIKVLVVIGPTSVGKTKMGVELAKTLNGEVISGDSMQIYKHMDIGTAKVTIDEMEGIKHHLIDIIEPTESFSVKDFQDQVRFKIEDITSRNKLPIIVGGTGLYIKGALYDYTFSETETKHEEYKEKFKDYTNEQLHDYLKTFDEQSALELHPNNRQRILRAIEIYETTGTTKSHIHATQQHICLYDAYFIGLTLDRDILYQRINKRVDIMIENGLEEEVTSLYQQGLSKDHQSMKAIGYKEWFDYFAGYKSKEEVIELIKQHSRQYAKRQYTWFKNQFDVHWYNVNLQNFNETVNAVLEDVL
ncbi:MAG: tRNA (adenosine(37)-N6)-dimethylallyltransferase MiaA [Erysipelotrichaceae bacterium]|nr:tRNA (adenosine(37)-N6)-dimethylallyltransferase MiaA [Erysipelotrichaceae bacterium]